MEAASYGISQGAMMENGNREALTGSSMLQQKRDTYYFWSILFARASLITKAKHIEEGGCDCLGYQKWNLDTSNSSNIYFMSHLNRHIVHTFRCLTLSPIMKLAPNREVSVGAVLET